MSEVVENVSEEQNSAQSNKAARSTEAVGEIGDNIEASTEAVPGAVEAASTSMIGNVEELSKPAVEESSSPPKGDKKTPVKRTPSKRMSYIERAQRESEELVKTMGGSLEMEGGRRTRSSTRGTPTKSTAASTPPPTKKSRTSPASGSSTPTRGRGRGRKIDAGAEGGSVEGSSPIASKKKSPSKGRNVTDKESVEDQEMDEKQEDSKETEKKSDNSKNEVDSPKEENIDLEKLEDVVDETKVVEDTDNTESNEEPKEDKEEIVKHVTKEMKTEDKSDGTLEAIVEEVKIQVTAESTFVEKIITKESEDVSHIEKVMGVEEPISDNPEETKEVKSDECGEKKSHNVESTSVPKKIKEPTPEPMEIDSSSISDDVIEKMEDDLTEAVDNEPQSLAPIGNEEQLPKEEESIAAEIEPSSINVTDLNNVNKVEESIERNSVEPAKSVVPAPDIIANNSRGLTLADKSAPSNIAFDNANENNTEETSPADNDLNKTDNLCEPKIATSSTMSADNDNSNSNVTTPQTCN